MNIDVQIFLYIRHFYLSGITEYKLPFATLTSDKSIRNNTLYTEEFLRKMGTDFTNRFVEKYDYAYSIVSVPNQHGTIITHNTWDRINNVVHYTLEKLDEFINALWYVTDNRATVHSVISVTPDINYSVHERSQYNLTFKFNGLDEDVYITESQLKEAESFLEKFLTVCPIYVTKEPIDDLLDKPNRTMGIVRSFTHKYNDLNRVERAAMMLASSRSHYVLPIKIAYLVPMFESLFTTAASELQHTVSERVAFYLEKEMPEREKTYTHIKDAYKVRSKFFHGDKLEKKFTDEYLLALSISLEDIARRLMVKIITEDADMFLKPQAEHEAYLSRLIFRQ